MSQPAAPVRPMTIRMGTTMPVECELTLAADQQDLLRLLRSPAVADPRSAPEQTERLESV